MQTGRCATGVWEVEAELFRHARHRVARSDFDDDRPLDLARLFAQIRLLPRRARGHPEFIAEHEKAGPCKAVAMNADRQREMKAGRPRPITRRCAALRIPAY
ncbi:hypothetical protein [Caballeronia sp. ATUFL_M1_KS5A]|uniref:hypothetical protein n=1 Tax=Caballeronia sp. ATUFL_M1_KS5A TaxID=2921778 RepID=UPI0020293805|nr:hypothetical protein [Caballeronia sp. ATUFL_M1_KS5A]